MLISCPPDCERAVELMPHTHELIEEWTTVYVVEYVGLSNRTITGVYTVKGDAEFECVRANNLCPHGFFQFTPTLLNQKFPDSTGPRQDIP